VVVESGLTERVAGLTEFVWTNPSDHVTTHGLMPVNAAWIVAESPGQILVEPLAVAFGASTVTV
jgi:hypothetical protein